MNFTQMLADVKEILNLEPAKRNLLIAIVLFAFLYTDNQSYKRKPIDSDKSFVSF